MPALHNRWGRLVDPPLLLTSQTREELWRALGLSDDFDSGAGGNKVVEVDHISVT